LGWPPAQIRATEQVRFHRRAHAIYATPHIGFPPRVEDGCTADRLRHTDYIFFLCGLYSLDHFGLVICWFKVLHHYPPGKVSSFEFRVAENKLFS
jgi:hypothetical protein